jgi:ribonucleoside-diphosphate reductase alpha chain
MRMLALTSFETGAELAKEKGEAPVLKSRFQTPAITDRFGHVNSNWAAIQQRKANYSGRELLLMSHYFDRWRDDSDASKILKLVEKNGSRYTHATSVAPTGTISLTFGNNSSNGIEPSFSHYYIRNKIKEGSAAKEAVPVYSYEFLVYKHLVETGKIKHTNTPDVRAQMIQSGLDENTLDPSNMPARFSVSDSVSPEQHIAVQEAAQLWVDSSISKTINVPTDISFDAFKDIYTTAYEAELKGCTTFRFNPEVFQGVLVRADDLKNTMYKFVLDDGSSVEVSGDTMIEYEGGTFTAANLFDSLKENYYGKL